MSKSRPPRSRQDIVSSAVDAFEVGEDPVIRAARRGKRGRFTAEFRYEGKHCRRALHTASPIMAQKAALKLHDELIAGRYQRPLRRTSLSDGLDVYINDCRGRRLRDASINGYTTAGNALIRFLAARKVTDVGQVKASHIDEYKHHRGDLHCNTLNNQIVILKTWFKFLAKRNYIQDNPLADVDNVKTQHTDHPAAKAAEVGAILAATEGEFRGVVALGAYAGLRITETLFLRVIDIDLDAGFIRVRETPERKLKNANAIRDVPIHTALRPLLAVLVGHRTNGLLFRRPGRLPGENKSVEKWTAGLANDALKAVAEKLGFAAGRKNNGLTTHALRRFFYTATLEARVPDAVVDVWCGHARQGMRKHYFRPQDHHAAMETVPFAVVVGKEVPTE